MTKSTYQYKARIVFIAPAEGGESVLVSSVLPMFSVTAVVCVARHDHTRA